MDNEELTKWNNEISEIRAFRIDATKRALKQRGLSRKVELIFVKMCKKLEDMGRRWRDRAMSDE